MVNWNVSAYAHSDTQKNDQRKHSTLKHLISFFVAVVILLPRLALAAEPSINISILGEVVGTKNAAMKGAFEKWISFNGKNYPLVDGAALKSNDGTMTILFRDNARMEMGRGSDLVVTGPIGSYQANVNSGNIGFAAPPGSSFSVSTPNAAIYTLVYQGQPPKVQQGDLTVVDAVRGVVRYDGRGTLIIAVTGTIVLRQGQAGGDYMFREGEAVYVAKDGTKRFIPAALIQRGLDGVPVAVIGGDTVLALVPLRLLGLAALVEGATYVTAHNAYASPSGFTAP